MSAAPSRYKEPGMNTTPPNERTLLGWMRANRNLLLFLVVLQPILLTLAYWAFMLVMIPLMLLFGRRRDQ